MKRLLVACLSIFILGASLASPAATSPAGACSFDYVISSRLVSTTRLADDLVPVSSFSVKGPGQATATLSTSRTNSVAISTQLSAESAAIGVTVRSSVGTSVGAGGSFTVPAGKYGKVHVRTKKYKFTHELTWSSCGSTTNTYKTTDIRTHYVTPSMELVTKTYAF